MTDLQPAAPTPPPVTTPQVAAGWYPHPTMTGTQRYWDGGSWTDHVAPLPPAVAQQPQAAAPAGRTANGMNVSYVRQQKGHSITKHLLLGWLLLWIPTIYYAASPNHYFHA